MSSIVNGYTIEPGANLNNANLYGANLNNANLYGADLTDANLTNAVLTGADLSGANLTGAFLTNVDLSGTDLTEVNLTDAYVIDANLWNVDLAGADLTGTNLGGSNLRFASSGSIIGTPLVLPFPYSLVDGYIIGPHANLLRANLKDANLTGANLTEAHLVHADLTGADLTGADLTIADLTNANLTGADLTGAALYNAGLTGADLTNAKLTDSDLTYARLDYADLTGADLSGAALYNADLTGADLTGADLTGADVRHADLTGVSSGSITGTPWLPTGYNLISGYIVGPNVDLTGADLGNADLSLADLTGADLTGADLTGADLTGANLAEVIFGLITGTPTLPENYSVINGYIIGPNVVLTGADLSGANLTGADLTGAALYNADLTGADLTGADLTGADVRHADLSYANLSGANLTDAVLGRANLDYADLSYANLSGAYLHHAQLSQTNLKGADLSGTDLANSYTSSILSGSITGTPILPENYSVINGYIIGPRVNLTGADLFGADLAGADLSYASLRQADLTGADLSYARLYQADLTGADLTNANLYKAIGVESLSQEQLASTISKMPTPTIYLNDADGVITTDEVVDWAGLSGTAYPGTTVTLVSTYQANGASESYTAIANDQGVWALTQDDVGETPPNGAFSLTVTATDGAGNVSDAATETLTLNLNSTPTGSVSISGTATQGEVLTAVSTLADADGLGSISYQWSAGGDAISGATSSTLTLGQLQVGKTITVAVSYTDGGGTGETVTSSATETVVNVNDLPVGAVTISGTVTQGETLTAVTSTISDADGIGNVGFDYQWFANDEALFKTSSIDLFQRKNILQRKDEDELFSYKLIGSDNPDDGLGEYAFELTFYDRVDDSLVKLSDDLIAVTPPEDQAFETAGTFDKIVPETNTFTVTESEVGKAITVKVSYTDLYGTSEELTSSASVAVVSADLAITTTITDRFGNSMNSADAYAYKASNGDQFFIREVGDEADSTVFEIVALANANISAIDFELTDNAGLTDFTVSDALADWTVQANTSTPNTVILSGFGAVDGSSDITSGQETVLATFTSAASPDFVISGIALNGAAQQDVSVDKITATSTTDNVTVFKTANGSEVLINADKDIDTASDKAIGAFDALQALRLAVGLDKSDGTSEWHDYIAADINKDGRVGADDALNILKFAVGLTDGPSTDWVFVDGDADWSGINRGTTTYDEGIQLSDIMVDSSINMTGILVGDVDGSYIA
tara:strand:+ start:1278 stop:4964 length:3687 start_codon:yes stop_codon:yes gene_type:complete